MKFVNKHWKKIIIICLILFFIQKIYHTFLKEKPEIISSDGTHVELFNLDDINSSYVDAFCAVETVDNAPVVSESTGKVVSVSVIEGDSVQKGQVLFTIENIQERVAVQNAKVALSSARLALSDLLANNNKNSDYSILRQTEKQQDILIESARNNYFNNDIRAYPEDFDEDSAAPVISGNYTCDLEGEYILDLYSSAAPSGATIKLSGLESGRIDVSTDYAVPLVSCGLEIVFPEDFKKTSTWSIPVPNTRSANYISTKKNYENVVSGKDIVLNNLEASPEQIAQQQARVAQAQLQLESTQDALSKTIVKAPLAGVLSSFDVKVGDFVSSGAELARVQSLGATELIGYINADEKEYIRTGNRVKLLDEVFTVESVSPTVDTATKKIKVVINQNAKHNLVPSTEYTCQIERSFDSIPSVSAEENGYIVPLSSISVIGVDPYVFEVVDKKAVAVPVESGALLGDMVVVYAHFSSDSIIRDARGVREGDNVK